MMISSILRYLNLNKLIHSIDSSSLQKTSQSFVKIEGRSLLSNSFNDLPNNFGTSNNRISILIKSPVEKMIRSQYKSKYSRTTDPSMKPHTFESLDQFLSMHRSQQERNKYRSKIDETLIDFLKKSKPNDENCYNNIDN